MQRNDTDLLTPLNWNFTDLSLHQPDCSVVTDAELKNGIEGAWQVKNGVARIPYTFGHPKDFNFGVNFLARLSLFYTRFELVSVKPEFETNYKNSVRYGLKKWEQLSNGTIEFFQITPAEFLKTKFGISFQLATTSSLNRFGVAAATVTSLDNHGYIKNSFILLPDASYYWSARAQSAYDAEYLRYLTSDIASSVVHEQGHALGFNFDGMSQGVIVNKLTNISDGIYCTPMTYTQYFSGTPGECKTNCTPAYAVYPAQLDQRMLELSASGELGRCRLSLMRLAMTSNGMVFEPFFSSSYYSFLRASSKSFLQHLSYKPDEYVLSSFKAKIAADVIVLVSTYLMEDTLWPVAFLLSLMTLENLPESVLNKVPLMLSEIIKSLEAVYLMNFALAVAKGNCPIPLALSIVTSLIGSVIIGEMGEGVGRASARGVSFLSKAIYKLYQPEVVVNPLIEPVDPASLITIVDPVDPIQEVEVVPTVSNNRSGFFYKVRNYFPCCKQVTDIENQLDADTMRGQEGAIEMREFSV